MRACSKHKINMFFVSEYSAHISCALCDVGNLLNTFCLRIFYQISSSLISIIIIVVVDNKGMERADNKNNNNRRVWEISCCKLNNVCRWCDDTKYFIYTWEMPEGVGGYERNTWMECEKRCENPHKTTKQLSSTNLIFFQFCTAEALETVFAPSLSHLLDLLPSLENCL